MSNKQARRAAKPSAAARQAASVSANSTQTLGRRLRAGTGMLIVGGALGAVGALLPWFALAGGTTTAGVESMAGIGTLVLGVTAAAIGAFILLRPDHPAARQAAWGALVAVLGIGALGVIASLTTGRAPGVTAAAGLLISIAGGIVATMGCRGLLARG
jgi:hypothetical protein